ncbi:MAG: DegT/DnrJ/EryC1/StrS family aminotransferase, partial [Kiritimatiellia bacterium]
CDQAWHMYYLLLPSLDARQKFIAHLKAQGISAVFHYLPLNLSDMGRRFGGFPGQCPVCEEVSDRLVRLPFFAGMTESDQQRVLESINTYR